MKQERTINKKILPVLIISGVTLLIWIAIEVRAVIQKPVIPKVLEEQLTPLDPKIDLTIVDELKERKTLSQEDFQKIPLQRKLEFKIKEATFSAEENEIQ